MVLLYILQEKGMSKRFSSNIIILTNGILLSDDTIEFLNVYEIEVHISLDSSKASIMI